MNEGMEERKEQGCNKGEEECKRNKVKKKRIIKHGGAGGD